MALKYDYKKLADFGKKLLANNSYTTGLPLISEYTKDIIGAHRCSIFIYDVYRDKLWTTLADGIEKIEVPSNKGIVGQTIRERKPIVTNDPYSNLNFNSDVDKSTGFKTLNIVTAPIFDSKRDIIGVLQLLNKTGGFDDSDAKFMVFFSHYISGFLELLNIYEEEENTKGIK